MRSKHHMLRYFGKETRIIKRKYYDKTYDQDSTVKLTDTVFQEMSPNIC